MNQNSENVSPKGIFKVITTLHYAFIAAPLLFSFVILIIQDELRFLSELDIPVVYYAIPFIAIAIIYAGLSIFKTQVSNIDSNLSLVQKLNRYQTAMIIRNAMIEGPAMLCAVYALLSEQTVFLVITWGILVYMYTLRPTKEKLVSDLKLNLNERKELD